jgi:hypothetical protein
VTWPGKVGLQSTLKGGCGVSIVAQLHGPSQASGDVNVHGMDKAM